jgi:hypothetical protein
MTRIDDEIRRGVLTAGHWTPDEIDRWLATHPKPTMLAEQAAILGERFTDLAFVLVRALQVPALARRLGRQPRQWVLDREEP